MLLEEEKNGLAPSSEEGNLSDEEKKESPFAAPLDEAPVEEAPVEEAPVEEAPVAEEPAAEEAAPVEEAPVEEPPVEEEKNEWADLKVVIDNHFNVMKNMLKIIKVKDANISTLSAEISRYREGFVTPLFKSLALSLIAYREDCLKAVRDLSSREFTEEDAKKYIRYVRADYEDFQYNVKIEYDGDKWLYNGKDIEKVPSMKVQYQEPKQFELPDFADREVATLEELLGYLKDVELYLEKVVTDMTEQDKLLAQYISHASLYEQGLNQIILYPVIRRIIQLGNFIELQLSAIDENKEYSKERYFALQEAVANIVADILLDCGVRIINPKDEFDPRMHRAIKFTQTDDPELQGKIAARFSDGYVMGDEEKVIYPQKVDLYRK